MDILFGDTGESEIQKYDYLSGIMLKRTKKGGCCWDYVFDAKEKGFVVDQYAL